MEIAFQEVQILFICDFFNVAFYTFPYSSLPVLAAQNPCLLCPSSSLEVSPWTWEDRGRREPLMALSLGRDVVSTRRGGSLGLHSTMWPPHAARHPQTHRQAAPVPRAPSEKPRGAAGA